MSLAPGLRLGVYEVTALIGAGGMGEVYRARDTRLGRDVAIKVLPDAVRSNPERVARFEREARMLAALNHPHVAAIHGVEEIVPGQSGQQPVTALVLELVEGLTLEDRLSLDGPLPLAEALAIARQIADALDAAHEKGIVHRDLKPANIKVSPDGDVKVLDFGLARLASDSAEFPQSPTLTAHGTRHGVVLGTARYMSPEQARGHPVDKRTDIWSFGCVLYELLTGRAAFPGETQSDTVAAILGRDVDWSALPGETPGLVRTLVARCLEKDPKRRQRDIGDARLDLEAAMAAPATDGRPDGRPAGRVWSRRLAFGSVVIALIASTAVWGWFRPRAVVPAEPVHMTVTLPAGVSITRGPGFASSLALSPDGRTLVIAGTGPDGLRLYRRSLDQLEATPVTGTEGGSSPFFSPDGTSIGFFADGRLKRVPAGGGIAADIVASPGAFPAGASWGPDDRIVFVSGGRSPVQVVDARGGAAQPLTTFETGESSHTTPDLLPDGRTLLFVSRGAIHALDLSSGRRAALVAGVAPRYVRGHLVFSRGTVLLAAPFDPSGLELTGPAVPLVEGVAGATLGVRHFAIALNGTLAYVAGARTHALVLVDANGTERRVIEQRLRFENPQFSPDGRHLAVAAARRAGDRSDLWVHDLKAGTGSMLTSGGGRAPIWTPDGGAITYSHPVPGERRGIYTKSADGRGDAKQIVPLSEFHWLVGWTPDLQTLAYGVMEGIMADGTSPSSIMAFRGGESRRVVGPGSIWSGRLSPDGRWLAYAELESGQFEVYVTAFPAAGTRWLIAEGTDPVWAPDGKELYYRSGNRLMAARVETAGGVRALSPRVVVEPFLPPLYDDYDVHPDGRTLVMVRPADDAEGREATMILNWFAEPSRLMRQ